MLLLKKRVVLSSQWDFQAIPTCSNCHNTLYRILPGSFSQCYLQSTFSVGEEHWLLPLHFACSEDTGNWEVIGAERTDVYFFTQNSCSGCFRLQQNMSDPGGPGRFLEVGLSVEWGGNCVIQSLEHWKHSRNYEVVRCGTNSKTVGHEERGRRSVVRWDTANSEIHEDEETTIQLPKAEHFGITEKGEWRDGKNCSERGAQIIMSQVHGLCIERWGILRSIGTWGWECSFEGIRIWMQPLLHPPHYGVISLSLEPMLVLCSFLSISVQIRKENSSTLATASHILQWRVVA